MAEKILNLNLPAKVSASAAALRSSVAKSVQVSPLDLVAPNGQWTSNTYMYLIIYCAIFLICMILSLGNYKSDDPTPYGHRILYAISAGLWNILYLVYYALLR